MTALCPLCKSEIADDNPAFLLDALAKWVKSHGGWSTFEGDSPRYGYPEGHEFKINDYNAVVVKKKTTYDSGDIDREGYYGSELPQGTNYEVFVVLKVGNSYFKKTGTADSYSEISWDGELLPVTPVIKTVEVYEFNG